MIDQAPDTIIKVPSRWWLSERTDTHPDALARLGELGTIFQKGTEALGGLYLRICDHIRVYKITPDDARATLSKVGFRRQRISEVLRVASAPANIYNEYKARLTSFRIALTKTRMYYMVAKNKPRYRQRQLQRAGIRLVKRMKENGLREWSITHDGFRVSGQTVSVCYIQLLNWACENHTSSGC